MASKEQWTMGSESVGGARRRFRRHKEKLQTDDTEPLAVRGMNRAIDVLTRVTARLDDQKANEDLLRSIGNTLTDKQKERLSKGVPAFKIGNSAIDEIRFDGKTWAYSFGQKDLASTAPSEMYRATPTPNGVDWERLIVGVDDGFIPFEPDIDDIKSLRLFAQDAANSSLQS